jgi:hypothetical protein
VDRQIKGYGFRGKEIYKMTITFKQNTTSFYDITIDQIKKSKLSVASKIDAIKQTNYSSIETVSSDSLNLKSQTNTYIDISDQPEWTFLSIKKSIFVLNNRMLLKYTKNFAYKRTKVIHDYSYATRRVIKITSNN